MFLIHSNGNSVVIMLTLKNILKSVLVSFLIGFITPSLLASHKIKYITADDGLSRNLVNHIFRDSKGFIWISTVKGLDRYDGYNIINFNSRNLNIPSDVINFTIEDNAGNFWIGTEAGLFFFDYKTGISTPSSEKFNTGSNELKQSFEFVRKDDQGNLWIGHTEGLILIKYQSGKYHLEHVLEMENPGDVCLFQGNIYVAQRNHVYRIIRDNSSGYNRIDRDQKIRNLDGVVNRLFYDRGFLWIGTGQGLYQYEPMTESLFTFKSNRNDPQSLSTNTITDIQRNNDGDLLIGTLIGLNIFKYDTRSFKRISSDKNSDGIKLNNNFISCIHPDGNIIWIGTEKGGINLLYPDQQFFSNVTNEPGNRYNLSENPVNAIYEDDEGDLWVGTVEGGLNLKKKGNENFVRFTSQPGNNKTLSHNSVSAICQDINGDFWIGTWGFGLNYFSKKQKNNPVFTRFLSGNPADNTVISNFVAALVSDKYNGGIWIGTNTGLDFYAIQEKRFYRILSALPASKAIKLVTGLYIDNRNNLWAGTGNGLFCIDLGKSDVKSGKISYKHFHYRLSDPQSEIVEKINCITQSKNGKVWFGSYGNGLYELTGKIENASFTHIDESEGLADNVIYGILEDASGTLWLSTDKGLSAYNPASKSIRNFSVSDGLSTNQFYWDAYCRGKDGKLYFGHLKGFTVFDPLKQIPLPDVNKVHITRISVLNEAVFPVTGVQSREFLKFSNTNISGLTLRENDKAFSLEFSALSYFLPEKIRYAYRLKGFDNAWKEVGSDRRFVSFTNIKYGEYTFEVKCTKPDGSWSDEITSLDIKVIPPFYKTWWFLGLLLIISIYSIYYFTNYRINSLKKQEVHLKKLVEIRTREIEEQKEKVQEATLDKIAFFTNITHEFRTPVTLILGPVERALKLSTNPKVIEQLDIVKRNSRLLLSLINQLMDFRKVESGKMELTMTRQDFIQFLEEILLPFEDLGKDRGIKLERRYRIHQPEFLFDKNSMQKLIGNLMSNALKFTPDKGTITIVASTYTDKKEGLEKLYVSVRDSGKGIPADDLNRIFERFYQSDNQQVYAGSGMSGTGIGLFLCKKITELYGGTIEAVNHHAGGAAIRFVIPVSRDNQSVVVAEQKPVIDEDVEMIEEPEETVAQGKKPLLLIVEDNQDMRKYIRSVLQDDFHISEASNGVEGLQIVRELIPDLIISDIMMPEMDGIAFCGKIRSNFNTSHIPLVLLTAKSSTNTQIEGFQHGADAFIVKPFDEELLKAVLFNLSEKKKKIQQNFNLTMDPAVLNFNEESQDKKFVDKALKIVRENYTNPDFDVTEFIDEMGISRSLLHKKLSTLTGQSASRFIRTFRLNTARELIIKNRELHVMNISEIAYQVGFNDPKYFTRCFTKQFGIQPSILLDEA